MSLRELARRTGTSPSTLSQAERDLRAPSLRTAVRIARELGVSLEWLAGGDP